MTKFNEYPVLTATPSDEDTFLVYDYSAGSVKQVSQSNLAYAPVSILGSLATEGDLPSSATAGDSYIISNELHIYDGTDWINVGLFTAPGISDSVDAAAESEENAALSESNAYTYSINASSSASSAASSANNASNYASDAANSESNAATSALNAADSASDSVNSATSAAIQAANVGSMLGINFGSWVIEDGELIVSHLTTTTPSLVDGELILTYESL
jgi:hypothetical protein